MYGKGVYYKGMLVGLLDVAQFHAAPTDTQPAALQHKDKGLWRAHWKLFQPSWTVSASTPVTILVCLFRLRLGAGGRLIGPDRNRQANDQI
jgi:hypothetical protein